MIRNNRTITVALITVGTATLLGLIGFGTCALLQHIKPAGFNPLAQHAAGHPTATTKTGDAIRKQAEQYWLHGDLSSAKSAYQSAYDTYLTEHNAPAAADAKIQIAILDQKLAHQNTSARP